VGTNDQQPLLPDEGFSIDHYFLKPADLKTVSNGQFRVRIATILGQILRQKDVARLLSFLLLRLEQLVE
jgi:hypothetical protein